MASHSTHEQIECDLFAQILTLPSLRLTELKMLDFSVQTIMFFLTLVTAYVWSRRFNLMVNKNDPTLKIFPFLIDI